MNRNRASIQSRITGCQSISHGPIGQRTGKPTVFPSKTGDSSPNAGFGIETEVGQNAGYRKWAVWACEATGKRTQRVDGRVSTRVTDAGCEARWRDAEPVIRLSRAKPACPDHRTGRKNGRRVPKETNVE